MPAVPRAPPRICRRLISVSPARGVSLGAYALRGRSPPSGYAFTSRARSIFAIDLATRNASRIPPVWSASPTATALAPVTIRPSVRSSSWALSSVVTPSPPAPPLDDQCLEAGIKLIHRRLQHREVLLPSGLERVAQILVLPRLDRPRCDPDPRQPLAEVDGGNDHADRPRNTGRLRDDPVRRQPQVIPAARRYLSERGDDRFLGLLLEPPDLPVHHVRRGHGPTGRVDPEDHSLDLRVQFRPLEPARQLIDRARPIREQARLGPLRDQPPHIDQGDLVLPVVAVRLDRRLDQLRTVRKQRQLHRHRRATTNPPASHHQHHRFHSRI